ncbi:sodium channel protein Nach-like isoform X2 [Maniola hyperantus]|uniref:sodium channel protein Nach-like isoform X2 n=1 Tax=Aphantopus hyperantus TaxID=2795564 RepID=UPI00374A758E
MPNQSVKLSTTGLLSTHPNWVPVMTEVGACHTINSVAVADIAIIKPTANITKGLPATCKYSPQGCMYILECFNTINYYIHSAFDIADTQAAHVVSILSQNNHIELATTETCSGAEVRALSPSRRHCRYFDEPTEPNRQVYSNNICRQECRSRIAMQACGCKPFYYYFAGMWCLAGIAHRLETFDNTTCPCVQLCVDSVIREISAFLNMWDLGGLKSRGVVRYTVQPPRTRYTRHIVFHFQDLVVSFGGAAGLFLGASFISFVEIGYFFIERILRIGGKKTDSKTLVKRHRAPVAPPPYESRIQELTSIIEGQNYYERNYPNYYY